MSVDGRLCEEAYTCQPIPVDTLICLKMMFMVYTSVILASFIARGISSSQVDGAEDTLLEDLPSDHLVSNFLNGGVDVKFLGKAEDFHGEGSKKQEDIELETLELLSRLDRQHDEKHSRYKRVIMTHTGFLWPGGKVPYEISSEVSAAKQKVIKSAMTLIEQGTCIRFYDRHTQSSQYTVSHNSFLLFVTATGCWSYVGRRFAKEQRISACDTELRALHEILHALGAFHEQSHANRDDYIHIKYGNMDSGKKVNFERLHGWYLSSGIYSAESVMHYTPHAMSSNGFRTIVPLVDYLSFSGTSHWNSFREVNKVYNCTAGCTLSCQNGGYPAFRDSQCKCSCVEGFDPRTQCRTFSPNVNGKFVDLTGSRKTEKLILDTIGPFSLGKQHVWMIKGPLKSKIALDFLELRVAGTRDFCHSKLVIKPANPGGSGIELCGSGFERTVMSERNILLVTLTSNSVADVLKAKVRLLPEDAWCYNVKDRGATYNGEMNRAEDNSECLKWTDAQKCDYNPFKMSPLPADYSGNACRNPGGVLARPWCYTNIDASGCDIKYCDACSYGRVYDVYDDCPVLLSRDNDYCNKKEGQYGCRKTCHFPSTSVTTVASCDPPKDIAGSSIVGTLAPSYKTGSAITYRCDSDRSLTHKRYCLSTGEWSTLNTVCGGEIEDNNSNCMALTLGQDYCHSLQGRVNCAGTCYLLDTTPSVTSCSVALKSSLTNHVKLLSHRSILSIGETAVYACLPGFSETAGDAHRTCSEDGTLTGQPLVCQEIKCVIPEPPVTDNVRVISASEISFGTPAVYECVRGTLLSGSMRRMCQSDGSLTGKHPRCGVPSVCVDIRSDCRAVLEAFPDMCSVYTVYSSDCPASCGNCKRQDVTCSVPTPHRADNSALVSSPSPLYPGGVVRYRCNPNKHLLSGHLERACRVNGTLTGEKPICSDLSATTAWINSMVMAPLQSVSPSVPFAIFGASKYTTVQRYGYVKCWKAYCVKPGAMRMVVIRRLGAFPDYRYDVIGQNDVSCHDDRVMTWCPSTKHQIQVMPGDLLGIVDLVGSNIQYMFCRDNLSGDNFAEYTTYNKASNIKTGHRFWANSRFQKCVYYGLNALLGPADV